jgi:hypothetical protein
MDTLPFLPAQLEYSASETACISRTLSNPATCNPGNL